jgi:putative sterol carrier protein
LKRTINSIVKDENSENQDPALKSISMVFKSLFGGSSSDDSATSSKKGESSDQAEATANFLKFLTPFITNEADSSTGPTTSNAASAILEFLNPSNNNQKGQVKVNLEPEDPNQISPIKLLKLLQPLLNENLVKEINLVYEFHIKSTQNQNAYEQDKYDVYYLDLKNVPNGQIGIGNSLFSKADCIIRTTDKDLNDLIQDKLKPFTAYMSGRIEIEGDLQDVFKLKKLIKSVTSVINPTLKK